MIADAVERAWDLLTAGDLEGALEAGQAASERLDSPEGQHVFGHVLTAVGRLEEALELHRAALELDPSYLDAMLSASDVLMRLGRFDDAAEVVEEALELVETEDERADVLLLLIDATLGSGHMERARSLVASLPDGPLESPPLDFLMGRARFDVGDVEGAAMPIEQASKQLPHDAEVFYYLGLVREALGDLIGSAAAFLECRQLDMRAPRLPFSILPQRFEREVQSVLGELAPEQRSQLDGVLVLVDDLPGAEAVSEGLDPRLPALFDEVELDDGIVLRRLFVYQRNVERLLPRSDEMSATLVTVLTEILMAASLRKKNAALDA